MSKPTEQLDWVTTNAAVRSEPSSGKKATGWASNERPPFQHFNWLFYNIDQWIKYFDTEIDDGIAGFGTLVDHKVGSDSNADYASLKACLDSGNVSAGDRILVYSSESMNERANITQDDVEVIFHPRVVMSKSGSNVENPAYAIRITGNRIKVEGGRFNAWSGGSDAAIRVESGANYTRLNKINFTSTCTEGISDEGTYTIALNNIEEI